MEKEKSEGMMEVSPGCDISIYSAEAKEVEDRLPSGQRWGERRGC